MLDYDKPLKPLSPQYPEPIPIQDEGNGFWNFELLIDEVADTKARLFDCGAWDTDKQGKPTQPIRENKQGMEVYTDIMDLYVKWDGCSHVNIDISASRLGETDGATHEGDGRYYNHLCGREAWVSLARALVEVYDKLASLVPKYADWVGGELGDKVEGLE